VKEEINKEMLIDFICASDPGVENLSVKEKNTYDRIKWERLIEKKLHNKFYASLNYPVLFLGLFLWGGIFGGIWFAYRGMLFFGALVWPLISVVTTYLVVLVVTYLIFFIHGAPLTWDNSFEKWYIFSIIIIRIVCQFILSAMANYIYIRFASRSVKSKKNINWALSSTKNSIIAFIILFLICSILTLIGWPCKPPGLFWG